MSGLAVMHVAWGVCLVIGLLPGPTLRYASGEGWSCCWWERSPPTRATLIWAIVSLALILAFVPTADAAGHRKARSFCSAYFDPGAGFVRICAPPRGR